MSIPNTNFTSVVNNTATDLANIFVAQNSSYNFSHTSTSSFTIKSGSYLGNYTSIFNSINVSASGTYLITVGYVPNNYSTIMNIQFNLSTTSNEQSLYTTTAAGNTIPVYTTIVTYLSSGTYALNAACATNSGSGYSIDLSTNGTASYSVFINGIYLTPMNLTP